MRKELTVQDIADIRAALDLAATADHGEPARVTSVASRNPRIVGMTEKLTIAAVLFALLTAAPPAHAATITDLVDFSASNFSCCAFGGSAPSSTPSFSTLTGSFTVTFNPFETAINSTTITLDSLNVSGGSLSYYDYTPAGFYPSSVRGGLPEVFSDGSLTAYGQIGTAELILSIADINTTPLLNVAYINGAIDTNTWISTNGSLTVAGVSTDPPSPTPLPAALPLFGSALLALAGFAAWQSRRAVRG
jgi:hypothetical protein